MIRRSVQSTSASKMEPRLIDLSGLDRRPLAAWRQRGWWGRSPLWERVKEVAARDPAKPAVIDADHVLSYGALWHAALRQAQAMRRADVDRGDVILVQLPNWHEFVVLAVAAVNQIRGRTRCSARGIRLQRAAFGARALARCR